MGIGEKMWMRRWFGAIRLKWSGRQNQEGGKRFQKWTGRDGFPGRGAGEAVEGAG